MKINHQFVDFIPEKMIEGCLYISLTFNTVSHKCLCGCGEEVVTPLSPVSWSIMYNDESVSLSPSIGNWTLQCKSHYWIRDSKIIWSKRWSKDQINQGKENDRIDNEKHYSNLNRKNLTFNYLLSVVKKVFSL